VARLSEAEIAIYAYRMKLELKSSTQAQIAQKIGVDQTYISRVSRGVFRRRVGHYAAILTYLDMQEVSAPEMGRVSRALKRYVLRGGDGSVLERMINLLNEAQSLRRA